MISRYHPRKGMGLVLIRNPHFHQWSADAQPRGFVDRIEWTFLTRKRESQLSMTQSLWSRELESVRRGHADLAWDSVPRTRVSGLRQRYPTQVHTDATG